MNNKNSSLFTIYKHNSIPNCDYLLNTHCTAKGRWIKVNLWQQTTLSEVLICAAATCLLPRGGQCAYQIPPFRQRLGLFLRLKLSGYLLSQWANSPCVHPYIALSTALRGEKKRGGEMLENDAGEGNMKNRKRIGWRGGGGVWKEITQHSNKCLNTEGIHKQYRASRHDRAMFPCFADLVFRSAGSPT